MGTGKPRASGDDPVAHAMPNYQDGVNPARAGMILLRRHDHYYYWRKPRASGDDPVSKWAKTLAYG